MSNNGRQFWGLALLAIVASVATSFVVLAIRPNTGTSRSADISAYDRILQQGTIRCGYVQYPPGCIKNPNTGQLTGVFVEALEEAGKNMGLKVEWAEEVGWGSMIEGLKADRYDLIGSQVWANSTRGKLVDFTVPLFFSGIGVYVRADDVRFDYDLSKINALDVRIATIDGEMSDIISKQDYPKAKTVSHPQLSDNSQILLDLVNNKADVTFVEPYVAELFLKNNPATVRNLATDRPIRIFPNSMMMRKGETQLKTMLDTALSELLNTGFVDQLMRKHVPQVGLFYPVAYPYRVERATAKP